MYWGIRMSSYLCTQVLEHRVALIFWYQSAKLLLLQSTMLILTFWRSRLFPTFVVVGAFRYFLMFGLSHSFQNCGCGILLLRRILTIVSWVVLVWANISFFILSSFLFFYSSAVVSSKSLFCCCFSQASFFPDIVNEIYIDLEVFFVVLFIKVLSCQALVAVNILFL